MIELDAMLDDDAVAALLDAPMDMALFDSMLQEDSDTTTASPVSSPSNYSDCSDSSTGSPIKMTGYPLEPKVNYNPMYPWAPMATPMPIVTDATMIPFAMPIPMAPMMQKRPREAEPATSPKRSKHEIRLMKNRESANKSRLRRKNQINDLANDVQQLTEERNSLKTEVAALRAENQSLRDQNQFLRGLVSSGTNNTVQATVDVTEETPATTSYNSKKLAAPVAGFVLCAFVFGMTLFSDPYATTSVVAQRRSMRVVHGNANPKSSNNFMLASPIGLLPAMSDYVYSNMNFIQSLLLNIFSALVVAALYVYFISPKSQPSTDVHVNVNVDSKLKRLCSRASRLVVRGRNALNLTKIK
ncbi:hypothetical protein THRCLA_08387 [Thraustotheca clavata]|uniref:BZIP domain-containing protein n=1 Tax=Thraustotheca clavata TaxID=74557 RepID=A0A1V9Z6T1_9STRA|nr:hypothetical protein THRCLA_08387 [Thraustotheca clavata]